MFKCEQGKNRTEARNCKNEDVEELEAHQQSSGRLEGFMFARTLRARQRPSRRGSLVCLLQVLVQQ